MGLLINSKNHNFLVYPWVCYQIIVVFWIGTFQLDFKQFFLKKIQEKLENKELKNKKKKKITSSQSSVDAIDAELQTAELLKLLILLEE